MVYQERTTWASLVAMVVGLSVYVGVLAQLSAGRPIAEVEWWPAMLWTVGGSLVAAIVLSVLWGIAAGMRDRDGVGRSDERDRDIHRMGSRVGQAFLAIGGVGALVLCAGGADRFWIAHAVFAGFALSALLDCVARVIAYRRGLD